MTEMIRISICSIQHTDQRLPSPVIFPYRAPIMQVPFLSHPESKAALFLSFFSSIVLVYLQLKATVQDSAEIIREAHSVSSLSAHLSVFRFYLLLSSFVHRLDWVAEKQVDKG